MNLWQSPGKLYCLKKNAPGQLFLWEKQESPGTLLCLVALRGWAFSVEVFHLDLWPSPLFQQPQLNMRHTNYNFTQLQGSNKKSHWPGVAGMPLAPAYNMHPQPKKQTQTMMGAPHKKAPPQGPLQAQLLLRFFWSYRLGQNILCMPVYVSLMHETEDVKHESCMCAMTSGLMNACASCPCLMSMPHVHAPCASEHAYASCASCSMCLMHVASCVCLMHVSHACASCMASFMCLMSMPHACMCPMIVPNKCALCKKQWYIHIYIYIIYIYIIISFKKQRHETETYIAKYSPICTNQGPNRHKPGTRRE